MMIFHSPITFVRQLTLVLLVVSMAVLGTQCKQDQVKRVPDAGTPLDYELVRFENLFEEVDSLSLQQLRAAYSFLFPGNYPDSYWLAYRKDSLYQELYKRVHQKFKDFDATTYAVNDVFTSLKAHYPTFKSPKVITLISNLDLNNQVIYADSLLLISLDDYLGQDSDIYEGFPGYVKTYLKPKRIPVDVAIALVSETYTSSPNPVFVERMIDAGKQYYALQQLLPDYSETDIFNYSDEKWQWALDNEYSIWQYFMEKEYLYSSEKDLVRRFLDPAPFSKFYITSDIESPGQIGAWMGWQIINSYAETHKKPLPELLATPSMEIFNQSNYKPHK